MAARDARNGGATGWIEVSVKADAESVESVAELFSRYAYNQGVVIHEPYCQDPDGENFEIDPTRPVQVAAYLPMNDATEETLSQIRQGLWHLRQLGTVGEPEIVERAEEDWANSWREHFQVTRIGRRFVVRPTWRDYQPGPGDIVIDLDPGMAFGTGMHPTTELCLRWMEDLPIEGARVLDAGAGSGILSIAAAKLGAAHIDAVEIDPVAVKALHDNVALNDLSTRIRVLEGDVTVAAPGDHYDLVIANILSRVLVAAAPTLAEAAAPGANVLLSGVIEQHESTVVAAFQAAGIAFRDRATGGDWVSLLGTKSG